MDGGDLCAKSLLSLIRFVVVAAVVVEVEVMGLVVVVVIGPGGTFADSAPGWWRWFRCWCLALDLACWLKGSSKMDRGLFGGC